FWGVPVLIYAEASVAAELFRRLRKTPDRGFRPVGVLLSPEDYWLSGPGLMDGEIPIFDVRGAAECATANGATWVLVGPCGKSESVDGARALDAQLQSIPNRVLLSSARLDV